MYNNSEGMPKPSHIGQPGLLGGCGVGWEGNRIDFEVRNQAKPYEASAWDEGVCIAAFKTNSKFVLWLRLWIWHLKFNRGAING